MRKDAPEREKSEGADAAPPVVLELGDGSRLVLEDVSASPLIATVGPGAGERISLEDATRGCGQPFAGYRRLKD